MRLLLVLAAATAAFVLASCAAREVAGFPWKDADGRRIAFGQSAGWKRGSEGSLGAERRSNRYAPLSPRPLYAGQALEIEARLAEAGPGFSASREAPLLRVSVGGPGSRGEAALEARFPLRDRITYMVLDAPEGPELGWLSVALEGFEAGGSAGGPVVEIASVTERGRFRGIQRGPGWTRLSQGFDLTIGGGRLVYGMDDPFGASLGLKAGTAAALRLERGPDPEKTMSRIASKGGGPVRTFRLGPAKSRLATSLGKDLLGEAPGRVEFDVPEAAAPVSFFACAMPSREAELADLGRILAAPAGRGGEDFSLYRWDLFPSCLVLDFKDYATQDSYLRRLAFFVEKAGFRGRLASDGEIDRLHAWNAHDYRPEDLAAFFEKARVEAFPLNAKERELKALLAERGILVDEGGRIRGGEGAIVSISRESPGYLRATLLVHESTHAIFFADAEFRRLAQEEWRSMGAEERWFWKAYFSWMNYDIGSEYLMANEYQAYLLQQPLEDAATYFTKTMPERLAASRPEDHARIAAYMEKFGGTFVGRARVLDSWLSRKYGIGAGRTYLLAR